MGNEVRTAIIGAGASGLAAAITAARRGHIVTVYDRNKIPGAKLLLTGNGKCNFSNTYMDASCFHETEGGTVDRLLQAYPTQSAVDFMNSIGINSVDWNGYLYPDTKKASDVVDTLYDTCIKLGVAFKFEVVDLDISLLRSQYDKVILACGSRAHKETGSNGSGYKYLEKLGVKYTRVLPALCALYCSDKDFCNEYKGRRIISKVSFQDHSAVGEVQFTPYGISGIPVFQISRYVSKALDVSNPVSVNIDFHPDEDLIPEFLRDRYDADNTYDGIDLVIEKTAGFDKSQVCTGGVSLDELTEGFELKKAPGVYVIGEMCDVDGICGGYNLHWAWLSGCCWK